MGRLLCWAQFQRSGVKKQSTKQNARQRTGGRFFDERLLAKELTNDTDDDPGIEIVGCTGNGLRILARTEYFVGDVVHSHVPVQLPGDMTRTLGLGTRACRMPPIKIEGGALGASTVVVALLDGITTVHTVITIVVVVSAQVGQIAGILSCESETQDDAPFV
jgi:hypothetical protein